MSLTRFRDASETDPSMSSPEIFSMTRIRFFLLTVLLATCTPGSLRAEPPSYAKQIKPFFTRYCLECHNSDEPKGGLNLETYKSLLEGGDNGAVLTPGKADASRIVRLVEHKDKPFMPPQEGETTASRRGRVVARLDRRRREGRRRPSALPYQTSGRKRRCGRPSRRWRIIPPGRSSRPAVAGRCICSMR